MRKYYNLDKMHETIKKGSFKYDVLSIFQEEGLDNALEYIKVSGICLNKYGKNKHEKYLEEILGELKGLLKSSEIEKITDLQNEIRLFQELIDKNSKPFTDIMNLPFLQSENSLGNLLIMGQRIAEPLIFGGTNIDSGEYELTIEAYSKVLWYFLFKKKLRFTNEFDNYEGMDDHIRRIIANALIDLQLGNWMDDWQFANTKILRDKKRIKIRISDDKMKVDIAKSRYLTTLEAKMSRQVFEIKIPSTERESLQDLYLNYANDLEFIKHFLNIENPRHIVDNNIGINLEDLCQTYFCLKELAFQNIMVYKESKGLGETGIPVFHINDIYNLLEEKGIEKHKIGVLISLVTFSNKSETIFETPLIQLDKNNYTLIPQITITLNITSSIMRVMSTESILGEKGYGYESVVRSLIEQNTNFKIYTNIKDASKDTKEDYELDGVFHIGKTLYLYEAKNFSHILNSFEYYKLRFRIDEALNQLKRNFDFYTKEENLIRLCKYLELDRGEVEEVKAIVINSSFLGETIGRFGFSVTEGILMRNFFKNAYPKIVEIQGNNLLSNSTIKEFIVYEKNGLTDDNLNLIISENPYIEFEKKRFRKEFKTYKPLNISIQFNKLKQSNISFFKRN